jgi:hypothetical protein
MMLKRRPPVRGLLTLRHGCTQALGETGDREPFPPRVDVNPGTPGVRSGGWRTAVLLVTVLTGLLALSSCAKSGKDEGKAERPARKPVELTAEVSRAEAGVSDPIEFRVTLDADPALEVSLPEAGSGIQGLRILDMGKEGPTLKEGRNVSREWYKLEADIAGSYVLPALKVSYRDLEGNEQTAETPQIFVDIKSSLNPESKEKDIRDLKPLEKIQREVPWKWIAAGGGALLALGCLAGVLLLRRRKRRLAVNLLPPEMLARRELEELEATGILEEERYREYVFNLSLIFRRYVERRFGVPAVEQTTEELLASLRQGAGLEEKAKQKIRAFLQESDPIKYCGFNPESGETGGLREMLLTFLENTAAPAAEAGAGDEPRLIAAAGGA